MQRIAVLVPCYNEAATIGKVVEDFRSALPEAIVYVYDNNSTDGSAEKAALAGAALRYERQQGKGCVIRRMFAEIDAECYMVSGERRLRAAKLAGLRSVPCILVQGSDERTAVMGLIENIQRSDLTFFEQAEAFSKLIERFDLTQESLALRLGMSQSAVANKLRLLRFDEDERRMIAEAGLSERHARALLRLNDKQQRSETLDKAIQNCWTVDRLEKHIARLLEDTAVKLKYQKRAVMLKDVRLFFNTVNKAVSVMKLAGVDASTKRINHEGYIEYIITIPQSEQGQAVGENSQYSH